MDNPPARSARRARPAALTAVVAALVLAWAVWPTLATMARRWAGDPRYSHGFLVAPFAVWLAARRGRGGETAADGPAWVGPGLIAAGAAVHLAGVRYFLPWVEGVGLLPMVAGLVAAVGGTDALRRSAPAVLFLAFMVPLPHRVEGWLGVPLQAAATGCSTYALQTLGLPAFAEGYVITLDDARIGVVEACNGLGMLVTFTALAAGVALVVKRPWWERAAVAASAVPIALAANVARITLTGALYGLAGRGAAEAVYHDLAGWLMMPLALALLGAELWLLGALFVESSSGEAVSGLAPAGFASARRRLREDRA